MNTDQPMNGISNVEDPPTSINGLLTTTLCLYNKRGVTDESVTFYFTLCVTYITCTLQRRN